MGKKNFKGQLKIMVVFLLFFIVCVNAFAGLERTLPENPLLEKADSVLILQAAGQTVSQEQKMEEPPEEEEEPPEEEEKPPEEKKEQEITPPKEDPQKSEDEPSDDQVE